MFSFIEMRMRQSCKHGRGGECSRSSKSETNQ